MERITFRCDKGNGRSWQYCFACKRIMSATSHLGLFPGTSRNPVALTSKEEALQTVDMAIIASDDFDLQESQASPEDFG